MAGITTDLELNIEPALSAIDELRDALETAFTTASDSLSTSVELALADLSVGAATDIVLNVDTIDAQVSVDDFFASIGAAPTDIAISADTTDAANALDDFLAQFQTNPLEIPVTADTTLAETELAGLQAEPIDIPVSVDLGDAISQFDDLAAAADSAAGGGGEGGGGGHGIGGLEGSVQALSATANLATGETEGLQSVFSSIGPGAKNAATGVAAFAVFVGEATKLAADAEAQNKRFNDTFGTLAESVKHVDVGGLSKSFEELGKQSGTSLTDLEATATKIGQLGKSSGESAPQVAKTTDQIIALGSTLAVQNPRLGDAASVSDRLTQALARGDRALTPFNLSITRAEINTRALTDTGKRSVSELTQFERSAAGAAIAVEKFGGEMGDKFKKGAENAQIQFRALKVQLEETISALGAPLLSPVLTVLTALQPIAVAAAEVLGSIAKVVLPLLAAAAPLLAPLVSELGVLAKGFGIIADTIARLPLPALIAIDVALVGLGAAAVIATFGVEFLANAIRASIASTGPIGLAIVAIGLLVTALGIFGGGADKAKERAKAMNEALFGSGSGADTLAGQVLNLSTNIEKMASSFINSVKPGTEFRTILDGIGGGTAGLSAALQGTDSAFKTYIDNIKKSGSANFEDKFQREELARSIKKQRDELIDQEKAQAAGLVTDGKAKQSDVDHAVAVHTLTDGTIDYVAVLKDLGVVADQTAENTRKRTLATSQESGALGEAFAKFDKGKESAETFAAELKVLGFVQKDATKFANDLADAHTKQTDAAKLGSAAAQDLARQFGAGEISAAQFEEGLAKMTITSAGVTSAMGSVNQAIDQFVSSAVKLVPTIDTALGAAEQGQSKAQQAQDKAAANVGKVAEQVQRQIDEANAKIENALHSGGKNAEAAVKKAQESLFKVAESGHQKMDEAAHEADITKLKLIAAADPQRVIDALNKGLTDIADFQKNLAKIVAQGGEALAQSLAEQGPKVAGAQAAAFANDPGGVKIAENLIGRTDLAKAKYAHYLEVTFGPDIAATMEAQAGIVSDHFRPEFGIATTEQVNHARDVLHRASDPLQGQAGLTGRAASEGYAGGIKGLHEPTQKEIVQAQKTIDDAKKTLGLSAGATAGETAKKYGTALDLHNKTKGAIDNSKSAWDPEGTRATTTAAYLGGQEVGAGFDLGIAQGILDGTIVITTQAEAVIAAAIKAATGPKGTDAGSPSKKGIKIGRDFTAGIAIGIADVAPIVAVSESAAHVMMRTFEEAGSAALAGFTAGFNDPATVDAAVRTLNDLLAKSAAQAQTSSPGASSSLDQFVSSAVSQLPSASQAISSFASRLVSDMGRASDATKALAKDQAQLASDDAKGGTLAKVKQDEAALANVRTLSEQATHNLHAAESQLTRDRLSGAGKGTIHADEVAVFETRQISTRVLEDLRHAEARLAADRKARTSDSTLQSDRERVAQDTKDLTAAQRALAISSDPTTFIKNMNAQTNAARRFQSDLSKLVAAGDLDLARQLASAGPDVAGRLAHSLASSPAKARLAEAAIDNANTFATAFQDELDRLFGPGSASPVAAAVQSLTVPSTRLAPGGVGSAATQTQTLHLDLTINNPDGTTSRAVAVVDIPPSQLAPKVAATVSAS